MSAVLRSIVRRASVMKEASNAGLAVGLCKADTALMGTTNASVP